MADLLSHNRIFVNQKGKLIEVTNEYRIRDEDGNDIGMIREEGQSFLKKVVRVFSKVDQYFTHQYAVYDESGAPVMRMTRPRKFVKSRVLVSYGTGEPAGEIVQENVFGKIRFGIEDPQGTPLGQIRAENWRAWNFAIVDTGERERARITKKWAGLVKATFTTADNYMLDVDPGLDGPLRFMTFASAAAIDTALKQDSR
jgi:uncharacterized protein YxjI